MAALILDGKKLAGSILDELAAKAEGLKPEDRPRLKIVTVGEDAASRIYVGNKLRAAKKCGIDTVVHSFPEDVEPFEFWQSMTVMDTDGLIIQMPIPKRLERYAFDKLDGIGIFRDVDGLGIFNKACWDDPRQGQKPCTAQGIMDLLSAYGVDLDGKHVVIINRSELVGKPLAAMMTTANATVTLCHSHTVNLSMYTRLADIVVVAVGKPDFLTADMIKTGAIVIDVGINKVGGKTVGDCAADVKDKAQAYTPVPGGVGPMTVAELMRNVWKSYEGRR